MSISLNTNVAAIRAASDLGRHVETKFAAENLLSSGDRLSGPSPDGAQLSVSMGLRGSLSRNSATYQSVSNALSYLQTQQAALQRMSGILSRMGEIATLMQDATKTTADLDLYAEEFQQIQRELLELTGTQAAAGSSSNATGAQFNGVDLFTSAAGAVTALKVFVSEDASQFVSISKADVNGLDVLTLSTFWSPYPNPSAGTGYNLDWSAAEISSVADNSGLNPSYFSAVDSSIEKIASMMAENGAQQGRLLAAMHSLRENAVSIEQAHGQIVDVDVAQKSQDLARANVLVDSGISALKQANSVQEIFLSLLAPR